MRARPLLALSPLQAVDGATASDAALLPLRWMSVTRRPPPQGNLLSIRRKHAQRSSDRAVDWVRDGYCIRAVETAEQAASSRPSAQRESRQNSHWRTAILDTPRHELAPMQGCAQPGCTNGALTEYSRSGSTVQSVEKCCVGVDQRCRCTVDSVVPMVLDREQGRGRDDCGQRLVEALVVGRAGCPVGEEHVGGDVRPP